MQSGWDHNVQYHGVVLQSVPPSCLDALDVGKVCLHGNLRRVVNE
jgi:hypothetical protein